MPPNDDAPDLILLDGTDELRLDDDAHRVYRPGDVMPKTLSHAKRVSLQAAGVRFMTQHHEPAPMPSDEPTAAPARAVVAEPVPADDAVDEKPRRAAKEKD